MRNQDITKLKCKCEKGPGDSHCPCNYINGINQTVIKNRAENSFLVDNGIMGDVHDPYSNFKQIPDSTEYKDAMKKCHSTECSTVLATAISAEAITLAGEAVSMIPFFGTTLVEGAWYMQMANRASYGVITFVARSVTYMVGLVSKMAFITPLLKLLNDLSTLKFNESYRMSVDLLMIYVPIVINGFLCILIGFWRRENIHKIFQTYGIVVTFYVPLMFLNLAMVGLMYLFPTIVEDVCKVIPHTLLVVTPDIHAGFTLLRTSYIVSTLGAFFLVTSSLLDDAYFMRKKASVFRKLLIAPFKKKETAARAETNADMGEYVNNGWMQAFMISLPIIVIASMSFSYGWKFVNVEYGPTGELLKVVEGFHGHTSTIKETGSIGTWFDENSLCGLIGKATQIIVKTLITDITDLAEKLTTKLEEVVDSVLHLSNLISKFESLGKRAVSILEDGWDIAERSIVLIVPLFLTCLYGITAVALPHIKEKELREEIQNIVKQLSLIGIYYNVALIILMQQLFGSISNLKLHVFYFQFTPGPLVMLGLLCSGLNAMSLFSTFIEKVYRTEDT
jgi:hypothetical protein